jgi:hypothetical protein
VGSPPPAGAAVRAKRRLGYSATLFPAAMESGGLTAAEDFRQFDRIVELTTAGRRGEAVRLLKGIQW